MLALLIPYLLLPLGAAALLWGKDRPWSAAGAFLTCTAGPLVIAYVLFQVAVQAPGTGPRGMVELFIAFYVGGGAWFGLMVIAYIYALAAPRGVEDGDLTITVPLLVPDRRIDAD